MNNKLLEVMNSEWRNWHETYWNSEKFSLEKGFDAACDYLIPLLEQSLPHVEASAGASHLTDGFKPKGKNELDLLVDRIKEIL
jgi:hypothetical protein